MLKQFFRNTSLAFAIFSLAISLSSCKQGSSDNNTNNGPVPNSSISYTPTTATIAAYIGITSTETFTLTNNSSVSATNLSISVASLPTGMTVSNNCSSGLDPNSSCTVTLSYTPTAVAASTTIRPFSISYRNPDGTTTTDQGPSVTYSATNPLSSSFDLSTFAISTSGSKNVTMTITNNANAPLTLNSPAFTGDFTLNSSTCTGSLAASASCAAVLTYTAGTTSGATTASATFTASNSSTSNTANINVIQGAYPLPASDAVSHNNALKNLRTIPGEFVNAIYVNGNNIYVGTSKTGEPARLYYSTNRGYTFSLSSTTFPTDTQINSIYASGNTVFAADNGFDETDTLYKSTDNGANFSTISLPEAGIIQTIFGASNGTIYVGGQNNNFVSSDGTNFSAITEFQLGPVTTFGEDSNHYIYAVFANGNDSQLWKSTTAYGSEFSVITNISDNNPYYRSMYIDPQDHIFLASTQGELATLCTTSGTCEDISAEVDPDATAIYSVTGSTAGVFFGDNNGVFKAAYPYEEGATFTDDTTTIRNAGTLPNPISLDDSPILANGKSLYIAADEANNGLYEFDYP